MRPTTRRFCLVVLVVLGLVCVPPAAIAGLSNAVIRAGNVNGVKVLQNSHRRTIYISTADHRGRPVCYGNCLKDWKPIITPSGKVFAKSGSGVIQKLLGTTRRRNGKLQVTYAGHPLYTYNSDPGPGYDFGQGCTDPSGHSFWIVKVDGKPVTDFFGCQGYWKQPPAH